MRFIPCDHTSSLVSPADPLSPSPATVTIPALFTRMAMSPNSRAAAAANRSAAAESIRSTTADQALAPLARSSSARSWMREVVEQIATG